MFEFHKYPSIDNTYRSKTINYILRHPCSKEEWVALLKVHGANFSVWTNGKTVKTARRKAFLDSDENFGSWQTVVGALKDSFIAAFEWMLMENLVEKEVVFWGELAGGDYPHPNVRKYAHAKKVQKGVFYAPWNFFYMFDISCDGKFLSYDVMTLIGDFFNITYAKPLKRGSFTELLNYPNEFDDPLHLEFGLPTLTSEMIKDKKNTCEGIVLKPIKPAYFGNGNRVILKNKNDKFHENNGEKKNKVPKEKHKWSVNGAKLFTLLSTYVSENRLRNVLSHGLDVGQKDFGKLMKELNIDTWDDFMIDNGETFECLDVKEQKMIKSSLNKLTANLIRPNFQNIVDGEF